MFSNPKCTYVLDSFVLRRRPLTVMHGPAGSFREMRGFLIYRVQSSCRNWSYTWVNSFIAIKVFVPPFLIYIEEINLHSVDDKNQARKAIKLIRWVTLFDLYVRSFFLLWCERYWEHIIPINIFWRLTWNRDLPATLKESLKMYTATRQV